MLAIRQIGIEIQCLDFYASIVEWWLVLFFSLVLFFLTSGSLGQPSFACGTDILSPCINWHSRISQANKPSRSGESSIWTPISPFFTRRGTAYKGSLYDLLFVEYFARINLLWVHFSSSELNRTGDDRFCVKHFFRWILFSWDIAGSKMVSFLSAKKTGGRFFVWRGVFLQDLTECSSVAKATSWW